MPVYRLGAVGGLNTNGLRGCIALFAFEGFGRSSVDLSHPPQIGQSPLRPLQVHRLSSMKVPRDSRTCGNHEFYSVKDAMGGLPVFEVKPRYQSRISLGQLKG
jgi:hypothetical protein